MKFHNKLNTKTQLNTISIVLLMTAFLASCNNNVEKRQPSLMIYQNATNIHQTVKGTFEQISYRIKFKYPAENFIEWLTLELKSQGWTPLKESFLNPGLSTSINRGWGSFIDGTTTPNQKIHQWITDWRNSAGDILTYGLQYKYPNKGTKDLETLYVYGNFIPKEVVLETLKNSNQQN